MINKYQISLIYLIDVQDINQQYTGSNTLTLHLLNIIRNLKVFQMKVINFNQVCTSYYIHFYNLISYAEGFYPHIHTPSLKTTPCLPSVATFSIYSQLPSIAEGRVQYLLNWRPLRKISVPWSYQ
jgi:hypothetical protein